MSANEIIHVIARRQVSYTFPLHTDTNNLRILTLGLYYDKQLSAWASNLYLTLLFSATDEHSAMAAPPRPFLTREEMAAMTPAELMRATAEWSSE